MALNLGGGGTGHGLEIDPGGGFPPTVGGGYGPPAPSQAPPPPADIIQAIIAQSQGVIPPTLFDPRRQHLGGGMAQGLQRMPIPAYWMGTPSYAMGGTHPGGPALVGEQGPEVVNLPPGSSVMPNPLTMALMRNLAAPHSPPRAASTENVSRRIGKRAGKGKALPKGKKPPSGGMPAYCMGTPDQRVPSYAYGTPDQGFGSQSRQGFGNFGPTQSFGDPGFGSSLPGAQGIGLHGFQNPQPPMAPPAIQPSVQGRPGDAQHGQLYGQNGNFSGPAFSQNLTSNMLGAGLFNPLGSQETAQMAGQNVLNSLGSQEAGAMHSADLYAGGDPAMRAYLKGMAGLQNQQQAGQAYQQALMQSAWQNQQFLHQLYGGVYAPAYARQDIPKPNPGGQMLGQLGGSLLGAGLGALTGGFGAGLPMAALGGLSSAADTSAGPMGLQGGGPMMYPGSSFTPGNPIMGPMPYGGYGG